jgi:hypothetical protein
VVKGLIGAGSLICQRIAAHSAQLSQGKKGSQRVLRLASGESTKRSNIDAEHLTAQLRTDAAAYLGQASEEELWVVADCSDLRKPYASDLAYLMQVPALDGKGLVPGYRTLNVLGITPGRRGILYHRLFSSQAPGFVSEPAEVQQAVQTVSEALTPYKTNTTITWITDRGFDDVAVWRTMWEQDEHVVCRVYHFERTVALENTPGHWVQANLAGAQERVKPLARVQTRMEVRARKTAASQAATGGSGNRGLSSSFDLCDQCPAKRARPEGLQNALVGESNHPGNNASSVVVTHRLACAGRAERGAYLHDVSRALGG